MPVGIYHYATEKSNLAKIRLNAREMEQEAIT